MNAPEPKQRSGGAWTQLGVGLAAGLLGAALGLAIALAVLDTGSAPDNSAAVEELRSQVQQLQAQLDAASIPPAPAA